MTWAERTAELLERLLDVGLVAIVKLDGEREREPWTVLITGSRLGGKYIRADSGTLEAALTQVVAELHEQLHELALIDGWAAIAMSAPPAGQGPFLLVDQAGCPSRDSNA